MRERETSKRRYLCILILLSLVFLSSCVGFFDTNSESERIKQHDILTYQYHDTVQDITICDFDGWIVLEDCGEVSSDFTLPTTFADGRKITSVGEYTFSNEEELVNVVIPDGYTGAECFSFMNCENIKTVYFGKDFNYIGTAAFAGCKNLRECVVSEDNPYFYSVDGCVISKEDSVLHISNGKVPDGVKKIRDLVFAQKGESLSQVQLPDTLEEIGSHAFAKTAITEIYIPNSVEIIGKWIFSGIDGIVINCGAESKPEGWDDNWLGGCTNYTVNWGVSSPSQSDDSSVDESFNPEESDTDMESDWKLIVNGVDITDGEYAEMISDGNSIPFVAVMEALGAEFEWENDRMARMKYLDLFFVLDVDKCILISEANDQEFFFVIGHVSIPSIPMDKELVLATTRVLHFFRKAGIDRDYNYEDRIVTINSNPDNVSYDAFTKDLFRDYLT